MIIEKLKLENYRLFKSFECEFSEGVNLVIGDNGAGKTSLLSAITRLMSVNVYDSYDEMDLDPVEPYRKVDKLGDATLSITTSYPVQISGKIWGENTEIRWIDDKRVNVCGYLNTIQKKVEDFDGVWPLINYQSFDRIWSVGFNNGESVSVEIGLSDRKDGYKDCLYGRGQDKKIETWCLKMAMLEFERKKTVHEFERFKHIIKVFFQTIEDVEQDFEIDYSSEISGLVMKTDENIYPLYELSTGYKAVLSMIMELAYRSTLLNPDLPVDSVEQDGIVVIDEIDAHLHPKWQWRVVDALVKCFPKVQFIIATHSPIVIAATKNARIISLEPDGKVSYLDEAFGYNVSDVLDLKQGSSAVPKVTALYMERLEKALDEDNLAEADMIVSQAMKEFGEESPAYKELKNYLEINRWVEEN